MIIGSVSRLSSLFFVWNVARSIWLENESETKQKKENVTQIYVRFPTILRTIPIWLATWSR